MKTLMTLLLVIYATCSTGQTSTGQEAADYSCTCTKKAIKDNKVNVTLLEQISKDYELLPYTSFNNKHKSNVDLVYKQIKENYNSIRVASQDCRIIWRDKYQKYQNDQKFAADFQKGLLKCHSIQGMGTIKKLKGEY